MKLKRFLMPALALAVVAGLSVAGYLTRETWLPWIRHAKPEEPDQSAGEAATPAVKIIVTDEAQKNLRLTAEQLQVKTIWKSIEVPGMVVDQPGRSDRSIVAPATGVVTRVAHLPGSVVRAGEGLFTLKLTSESLHQTQTDLFKAGQDIQFAQEQRKRLVASRDSVPESRIFEMDNQITRLRATARAYRRELLNRGLTTEQIEAASEGRSVNTIDVVVPAAPADIRPLSASLVSRDTSRPSSLPPTYEVQELKVELGQQVQAGQTLCLLANHQALAVEGRAFRDEVPLLERNFRERAEVKIDFFEDARHGWPKVKQEFRLRHLANTIDPVQRTFAFLIPLENQSQLVEDGDHKQLLWRFRPGQKVRIRIDVEEVKNVFVLPPDAVVREGAEAFVFTQNVNSFERKPVHVVFQHRDRVVIDNDGSLETYAKDGKTLTISVVVQTAAAQLNRMARAGTGGVPKGYHMHADGSLHKNHD